MSLSWVTGKDSQQRWELSVSGQMGELSVAGKLMCSGHPACHRCGRVGVVDGEVVGKETSVSPCPKGSGAQ